MADAIHGNTQLGATKQDVITALVQKELQFRAKLSPTVLDVSPFAQKGAKSISFPKFDSFSVIDRATATAGDASVLTGAADKMDLEWNAYVAWIVDSSDEVQSTVEVQSLLAVRAAGAMGRYVDSKIIDEAFSVAGFTSAAATITRDIILDMAEFLEKSDADMSQVVLVIPPTQKKAMLKITEFTSHQVYGRPTILNGQIGEVYGIPVLVHNGVNSAKALMYEKEGLALGFQKSPMMSEQGANEYGSQAKRVAMDQLFGVQGLHLDEKGVAAGKSALVASMTL